METVKVRDFYRNKKVFITGHTGFKGTWLTAWLHDMGATVIGLSKETTSFFDSTELKEKITHIEGDIRDQETLHHVFQTHKPEIVFHLAAQTLVIPSYEDPIYSYEVNVIGTLKVLEAFRACNTCQAAIIVTSDKCYENKEQIWGYRENDPMGGFDPYSSSKGCCEILVSSYRRSYFQDEKGKKIASVRAGNVIGGGDFNPFRIIPDVVTSLENKKDITLRSPEAVRPWQHVLEPLLGYLMVGKKLYEKEAGIDSGWNFGPTAQSIVTVNTLVHACRNYWGMEDGVSAVVINSKDAKHEAGLLSLDSTKAMNVLKWQPKWNFEETVAKTMEWYKEMTTNHPLELCQRQIRDYEGIDKVV